MQIRFTDWGVVCVLLWCGGCYSSEHDVEEGTGAVDSSDSSADSGGDADSDADTDSDDADTDTGNTVREPDRHRPVAETCESNEDVVDECISDDDCASPYVCECNAYKNRCFRLGNCRTDDDCGKGGYCSPSFGLCGNYAGDVGYFCHASDDDCIDDADCASYSEGMPYCAYNEVAGRWMCSDSHCVG